MLDIRVVNWMVVPVLDELRAVLVDQWNKQSVNEPYMEFVGSLKSVRSFKAKKKRSPCTQELLPHFDPQPFDPGIVCGSGRIVVSCVGMVQNSGSSRSPEE